MTTEEIERELKLLATKLDLEQLKTEMHKELHNLSWKIFLIIAPIYALFIALILALIPHLK